MSKGRLAPALDVGCARCIGVALVLILADGRDIKVPEAAPLGEVHTEAEALARMKALSDEGTKWNIGGSKATIRVDYSFSPALGFWLPATMSERYEQPNGRGAQTILTHAQYDQYRRFQVDAKIK